MHSANTKDGEAGKSKLAVVDFCCQCEHRLSQRGAVMKKMVSSVCLALTALGLIAVSVPAAAGDAEKKSPAKKGLLILYNGQKFQGDYLEIKKMRTSMGEDMLVGSIAVFPGEAWEICEGARFKGACRVVTGDEMGLGSIRIMSVRPAPAAPAAPASAPQ
jgi:hypothetical protein